MAEEPIKVTIDDSGIWKATEVGGLGRVFFVLRQSRSKRTKYSMVPRKIKRGVEYEATIAIMWDEPRGGYSGQVRLYPL